MHHSGNQRLAMSGVLCALGFAWIAGCDEPTADDASPGTDRDVFALAMAEALCGAAGPCCAENDRAAPSEDCETAVRNEVFIAILNAEQEQRSVNLEASTACVETYRSSLEAANSCFELPHPEFLVSLCPELFSDIPEGALTPGEPCEGTYQCSAPELGERVCYRADFNEASLCTWFVPTAAGEPCEPSPGLAPICPDGLGCAPVELSAGLFELRCEQPRGPGEACHDPDSCLTGYACSLEPEGTRVCVPELAQGEACLERPDACLERHYCSLPSNTCEKLPVFEDCVDSECKGELNTYCR